MCTVRRYRYQGEKSLASMGNKPSDRGAHGWHSTLTGAKKLREIILDPLKFKNTYLKLPLLGVELGEVQHRERKLNEKLHEDFDHFEHEDRPTTGVLKDFENLSVTWALWMEKRPVGQMTTVGAGIQTLKMILDMRFHFRLETMSLLAGLLNTLRNLRDLQQEDFGADPPWLVRVERAEAERLLSGARDGSFVVRPSRGEAPFALSLRFGGRPFHLRVRRRTDGRLALGSEKPCERSFDSLGQLVEHHCREPILLTSRGCPAGRTTLALPPLT
ncbi:hypothetical protein HPB51_009757 [Rhipicephalus microplus]|uniref:SH2 domain-containing protein n=1 Tax=Rhipicephalus microplus TaxID=6941 RepID=A0A9J6F144_RHIMP|nr:hypothetical protein HPB51_009757 [Rhipicephalus microplus]